MAYPRLSTPDMDTLSAWKRAVDDPQLQDLPYKVETNEYGQLVLSPTRFYHTSYQATIYDLLRDRLSVHGRCFQELAVETSKGVKVPDVAWISDRRLSTLPDDPCALPIAPEICVEVYSSSNTGVEMATKGALYFEKGAEEVWTCDRKGRMRFFTKDGELESSRLVPDFPHRVD